jgi:hypothetical protein
MDYRTNHINFNKIEFNKDKQTLEFKEPNSTGGWFLIYAFIDELDYINYLGMSFNFMEFNCNAIVLTSDNYLDSINLIIEETWNGKEIIVSWKYEGQNLINKEVLCVLNEDLKIISNNVPFQKMRFSSINELIHEIDSNYFFDHFESY